MTGPFEAKHALAVLVAAFRQENLSDETLALYAAKLRDINGPLLEATVNRLIDRAKFFPAIAEIRQTALELAGLTFPSPDEALGLIHQADVEYPVYRRDGTFAYTEREWRWPENVPSGVRRLLWRALEGAGDPVRADGSRVFGWEKSFQAAYQTVATEAIAQADLSRALPAAKPKALTP